MWGSVLKYAGSTRCASACGCCGSGKEWDKAGGQHQHKINANANRCRLTNKIWLKLWDFMKITPKVYELNIM